MKSLVSLIRDEDGQSMVEYGIIVAVIAAVCITAFTKVGQAVNKDVGTLANNMSNLGGN